MPSRIVCGRRNLSIIEPLITDKEQETLEQIAIKSYKRIKYLRLAHMILASLIFMSSGASFVCLGYIFQIFAPNCILGSRWVLRQVADPLRQLQQGSGDAKSADRSNEIFSNKSHHQSAPVVISSLSLILDSTTWGPSAQCNYTQYSFGAATMVAFVLGWFFLLFRPNELTFYKKKATSASKLVLPALVLSTVLFVVTAISSILLQTGWKAWCSSLITPASSSDDQFTLERCSDLQNYRVLPYSAANYYRAFIIAQALAYVATLLWLSHAILLIVRFANHYDFPDFFFFPSRIIMTQSALDLLMLEQSGIDKSLDENSRKSKGAADKKHKTRSAKVALYQTYDNAAANGGFSEHLPEANPASGPSNLTKTKGKMRITENLADECIELSSRLKTPMDSKSTARRSITILTPLEEKIPILTLTKAVSYGSPSSSSETDSLATPTP